MDLTVKPTDVSGAPLPVACTVTVRRNGTIAGTARCPAGAQAAFKSLGAHDVHQIAVEADGFHTGTVTVVTNGDLDELVPCVLRAADCCPDVPRVELLPSDLRRLLETYELEAPSREVRGRDVPTRTLPCACAPDRTIAARDIAGGAVTPLGWATLTLEQRGGLLNLYAKMRSITVGGRSAWSYVERLLRVDQDRIHVEVDSRLACEVRKMLDVFKDADDSLHEPGEGYRRAGSVKSREPRGNLQLSFSVPADGGPMHVDADVDEAAGLGHVTQVLRNWLTGGKTDPFDVHQILVAHQRASTQKMPAIGPYRPGYRLGLRAGPADYRLPAAPPV